MPVRLRVDHGIWQGGRVSIRYPAPLGPGDRIAVTSPSAGVGREMRPRLEFCIRHLRDLGDEVVVGDCMDGSGALTAGQ